MVINDGYRNRSLHDILLVGARRRWLALILCAIASVCLAGSNWWSDIPFRQQLAASIHEFAGNATGDYFQPNGSVASQIGQGLGGPPNPAQTLGDSSRLLSASRPHSGDEKAAVVIDTGGNVIAAAIISFGCHYVKADSGAAAVRSRSSSPEASREVSCQPESKLTIFWRETFSSPVREAFLAWARLYSKDIRWEERRLSQ